MSLSRILRLFLFSLSLPLLQAAPFADCESEALIQAVATLDHYFQAGVEKDAQRGAGLLTDFDTNARRAEHDTLRLYRRQQNVFSSYISIAGALYGYEIQKGLTGTSVELEGGIETASGVTAEYKARMVLKNNRWRIAYLEVD